MQKNIHKKATYEDKFAREYYGQRAKTFIKHQKKSNNKKFRKMLEDEIARFESGEYNETTY